MLEINEKQLLSFDNVNRARILKMIVLGLIKYVGSDTNEYSNNANSTNEFWRYTAKEKDTDKEEDIKKEKIKKKFQKPTIEEIQQYCLEKKYNVDAQYFIDYYESNGWKVGRNPMKDWKATIRTWNQRNKKGTVCKPKKDTFEQREYGDLSYLYANKGEWK